jgi:phosphate transport system permease protein
MTTASTSLFEPRLAKRRRRGQILGLLCGLAAAVGVLMLGVLLVRVFFDGASMLSLKFLTNMPSQLNPENSGVKNALVGTLWLLGITATVTVPIGVGAAVFLQEFAKKTWFTRLISLNIANLAGVPSIVYGMLGLVVFVRIMTLGRSVLSGALTLSLLILPVVIIASREALLAVPQTMRSAAFALGATRWQTVRHHVLPAALPGIVTGVILALSRAIGEAAPLIMIGALAYVSSVPTSPLDQFTAMPIQIYNWCDEPQQEFHKLAAAGIIVLLVVLLSMNALAVAVRGWQQRHKPW